MVVLSLLANQWMEAKPTGSVYLSKKANHKFGSFIVVSNEHTIWRFQSDYCATYEVSNWYRKCSWWTGMWDVKPVAISLGRVVQMFTKSLYRDSRLWEIQRKSEYWLSGSVHMGTIRCQVLNERLTNASQMRLSDY